MAHKSSEELIEHSHNTARFFVEHPQVSWMALVALFAWGIYGYIHLPQRKDPDIPVRVATATCNWPGATAAQVEQLVTRPIEDTIAQNKYVHAPTAADYGIRSETFPGHTIVWVQLRDGLKNPQEQFSDINLRLEGLNSQLPQGAGPISFKSDFGDTTALMLTVASPEVDASEIALRAREMRQSILAARHETQGQSDGHVAIALMYPMAKDTVNLDGVITQLRDAAESSGWLRDASIIHGDGFIGLDGVTSWSESQVQHSVDDFITRSLPASSIDPDVWSPLVVRDLSTLESHIKAIAGPKYTYAQLNDYTDLLTRNLQSIPQTSRVDRTGLLKQQVQLEFPQEELGTYGTLSASLSQILASHNTPSNSGSVESGPESLAVKSTDLYKNASSIGDTIVGTTQGTNTPIYLRDLVHIHNSYAVPPTLLNYYAVTDGSGHRHQYRAVTLGVYMRPGENINAFGKAIDQKLQDARVWLPSDIILARTSDQPLQVRENIHLFMDALLEAVGLVVLVSLLGFWDWRSALLMSLSIPITLAMAFGLMYVMGLDLQQVSIASLIIALGLLVDDPVVANDAIKREIAAGLAPAPAAWIGPTKLATAILYATATNIIAYLPFLMLPGNTGMFLFSLPLVMTAALVSSRLVSMTFIPLIARYILTRPAKPERTLEEKRKTGFYSYYLRVVESAIAHRWKFLLGSFVFLALGVVVAMNMKTEFFPDDVQYWSYVDIWLPVGTPIAQTKDATDQAERIISQTISEYARAHHVVVDKEGAADGPQLLQSLTSFAGGGGPRFWFSAQPQAQQSNYGLVLIRISNKDLTPKLAGPLQDALAKQIPGAQIIVHQLQTNPVEFPVEVRVSSTADVTAADEPANNEKLLEIASQAASILRNTRGSAVTQIDWLNKAPQLEIDINADKANLLGIGNTNVAQASLLATDGVPVTTLQIGNQQIPVVARLEPQQRASLSDLENMYVSTSTASPKIPLRAISDPQPKLTTQLIRRQEHFRTVGVHAWPDSGVLPSEVLKQAMPKLNALKKNLPPGYQMIVGGEYAKQQDGFQNLSVVLLISIAGIYAALLIQFKNAIKPLLVFAAVPYGVVGALLGLLVTGTPFGFMAFLGVISLIGVIVSHIIVLFDFIEERHEAGEPIEQALGDAGIERLRPVLITVGATIFALFPLAMHGGPLWQPLCYAQIGGLAVATFITLLLVPVLYSIAVLDLKIVRWEQPH
ncbi:efflux RND transporter permease subunit [Edaphobacter sp. HDX4]|uniref:efflux RND transporter permease subunit n=1 Tax=Edaphobacter sp. HDX4 TaxID=2794064 RepID=UPI002FE6A864